MILVAAALLLQVQVREEPKDWKLLKSANFDIYYPSEELEARARQFAGWFEDARVELARETRVEPARVHVFLYRSFHDLMQASFLGGAFKPLPDRMRQPLLREGRPAEPLHERPGCLSCRPNARSRALALAEPLRDRILIHCQASDRWNYWFAKHELAHHVQFQHFFPFRMPSWAIALKDPLIPSWVWEGGADYLAGAFDSRKDEWVRDLAQEELYTMKELFNPDILPPHDFLAIYYQGSYFWRFLDERYGKGSALKVFDRFDRGLPLASQKPVQNATGRSLKEVEADFASHLAEQWAPMLEGRAAPADRLTDTREYYRRRAWGGRWSPDGRRLAWVGNADVHPELYVDGAGVLGWDRGIDGSRVVSPPSWSPDGTRLVVVEWRTNRDLLLLAGAEGGTESIELDFDELYDPAWSPDGKKIAFAALKHGTSDLYVLNLDSRQVERVTQDDDGDSGPAWSPDGTLAWIKESEGRTVLHVAGRGAVTKSWALLEYPQWSPDGKSIVVAADVGGIWDAFAVDPATGKAKRLTKVPGGVHYPSYHPDGSLVVTYFQGRGTDLFRVKSDPQDEPAFDQEERKPWYEPFKRPAPRGEPAEKTRVWGVDWLMFPVSSLSYITPALEFGFGDRDAENSLWLGATGTGGQYWGVGATAVNTRHRATVGATAYAARAGDLIEFRGMPFVEYPLWRTLTSGVGWVGRDRAEFEDDAPDPDYFDSGPTASLLFTNRSGYQYADAAWGVAFGGSVTYFDESLGGDRDLREYFGFFETSFDLTQDYIVWSRVTFEKLATRDLLESELLEIEPVVRGAEDLEGFDRGAVSLEFRFPIYRDFYLKPFAPFGLGEWWIVKDVRGFVFGQVGYTGFEEDDLGDDDFAAASAGVGVRLDFSIMLWPLITWRIPARLEFWWAIVGEDNEGPRGAVGVGIQIAGF